MLRLLSQVSGGGMDRRMTAVCVVCVLAAAACSGSSNTSGADTTGVSTTTARPVATAPTTTAPTTTAPTTTAAPSPDPTTTTSAPAVTTTTTEPPAPPYPAGAQFLEAPESVSEPEGQSANLGDVSVSLVPDTGTVSVDTPAGSSDVTLPVPTNPRGFPLVEGGTTAISIAAGPSGFVAVGTGRFRTAGLDAYTYRGAIWHSSDGTIWTLVDLGALATDSSTTLISVTASDTGFIAVGAIGAPSSPPTSQGLILTSPDAVTWTQVPAPQRQWPLGLDDVRAAGGSVLLTGREWVCGDDGGGLSYFGEGGLQPRMWTSGDGMTTWQESDVAASGMLRGAEPPPTDPAACPPPGPDGAPPADELDRRFGESARVELAGDIAYILDGGRIAVSSDGSAWNTADLPGATPVDPEAGGPKIVARDAALVRRSTDGLEVISLERDRDANDRQVSRGSRTIVWTSTDAGLTWVRLPAAGRAIVISDQPRIRVHGDAVEIFTLYPVGTNQYVRYVSVAGPPEAGAASCQPAAAADCFFTTLQNLDLSDANLDGIDLRSAVTSKVDLSGASLVGARLSGGANFSSDFTGADLSYADLLGTAIGESVFNARSLAGATLMDLKVFWVDPTALHVDLSGLDLTDASIAADSSGVLPFTVTAAQGTNLSGFRFDDVDLTGSNFGGAVLTDISFGSNVVCPDGAPPTSDAFGPAACRL
ncbi:MAG: hypothetical protein JWL72_2599 [Ilumatobacteraceae bacterium]|nr:hypothetical protein [Ilumatobacteraceae bacterium]